MKSFLLIGLGRLGRHIAIQLHELGHQIMGVDSREERVEETLPYLTNAQIGDSTNEDFLRSLGVDAYDVCIVAISGSFQASLETTSLLKELGARFVVARAERDRQSKFLLRNGADDVVYPEKQAGRWTAIKYSSERILDYVELDDDHAISEVTVPEAWLGKTVRELDIRKKYGMNIMAIKQDGKMNMKVEPDTVLTKDMTMLVLGEDKMLQEFFQV